MGVCQSVHAFEPSHYEANDKYIYAENENLQSTTTATYSNLQCRADVNGLGNRNAVIFGDNSNRSSYYEGYDEPDV